MARNRGYPVALPPSIFASSRTFLPLSSRPTIPQSLKPHGYFFYKMKASIPGKGILQGTIIYDAVSGLPKCTRFSRVPYALPPLGKRRWRKPEPLPSSFQYGSDNKRYTRPSPICPQPRTFGQQSPIHDEDCLYSNIWVPHGKPPASGWPVLFYIRRLPF